MYVYLTHTHARAHGPYRGSAFISVDKGSSANRGRIARILINQRVPLAWTRDVDNVCRRRIHVECAHLVGDMPLSHSTSPSTILRRIAVDRPTIAPVLSVIEENAIVLSSHENEVIECSNGSGCDVMR